MKEASSLTQVDTLFVVNVQVMLLRGEEVLLIERGHAESHAPGMLDLPGGKLEMTEIGSEPIERCARRELEEETGVKYAGALDYVTSALFVADDGVAVTNLVLRGELDYNFSVDLNAGEDEINCFWFSLSKIDAEPRIPKWTKEYIHLALMRQTDSTLGL